jgi:shikimate dehydrogenase
MTNYRFAVLGAPISHSRSPQIHAAMLEIAGLDGTYERILADRNLLADTIAGLRSGQWHGLNITVPLKMDAAEMADRLSPRTEFSGSINTLLFDGEEVYGESTDSITFEHLFHSSALASVDPILILGSGGSATAALASVERDRQVYLSARNAARVETLADHFECAVVGWGSGVADALVVNATTLGMGGEELPGNALRMAGGVIDLPYREQTTPTTQTAIDMGIPHVDGHEFLLRQAIASFRLWTGESVDLEVLRTRLRNV